MSTNPAGTELVKADPLRPFKALAALVGTFCFALATALADRTELATMTTQEWLLVILGALATSGVTFGVPNPKVLDTNPTRKG